MVQSDQIEQSDLTSEAPASAAPRTGVVWTSEEILRGEKEVQITHHSETYRLRLTRNGKLILCK